MTERIPDRLFDGVGSDPELEHLEELLGAFRKTPPLPELPARRSPSWPWLLAAAALLLLGVVTGVALRGSVSLLGGDEVPAAGGEPADGGPGGSGRLLGAGRDGQGRAAGDAAGAEAAGTGDASRQGPAPGDGAANLAGSAGVAGVGTLFVYETDMAESASPVHVRSGADLRMQAIIGLPLYAPNYADQPSPVLAASQELDATGRVLTIELRETLWSDGEPVTADDVVFTLEAMKSPGTGSLDRRRWDFIERAEAVSEQTLELTLAHPVAEPPLGRLYLDVLPRHAFGSEVIPYDHPIRMGPVGAGSFLVAEKDHKHWVLRGNPLSLRPPRLAEVRVQEVPERRTQAELMSYRYGHVMVEIEPQQRAELEADFCCTVKRSPSKRWWFVAPNQANEALGSQEVREALALALERQSALDLLGDGELISGPFTLSSRYYDREVEQPEQDLARAAALMEEAGFVKDEDVWTRAGAPVQLRFVYDAALGEAGQLVATNLVGQLKRFGLDVSNPTVVDATEWEERIRTRRDYDLALGAWSFDQNEDVGQLFTTDGVLNFTGYSDVEVDTLVERAYESRDPSEQQALMRAVHRRVAETHPYLFLWSPRRWSAVSVAVQGAHIQAGTFFDQLPDWRLQAP